MRTSASAVSTVESTIQLRVRRSTVVVAVAASLPGLMSPLARLGAAVTEAPVQAGLTNVTLICVVHFVALVAVWRLCDAPALADVRVSVRVAALLNAAFGALHLAFVMAQPDAPALVAIVFGIHTLVRLTFHIALSRAAVVLLPELRPGAVALVACALASAATFWLFPGTTADVVVRVSTAVIVLALYGVLWHRLPPSADAN